MKQLLLLLWAALFCLSCSSPDKQAAVRRVHHNDLYDLEEIQQSGEIIVLTLFGPDTYYDYRGKMVGYQFQVAEQFGKHIGARVRVEVGHDENDLITKLVEGEGDLIGCTVPDSLLALHPELTSCGDSLSHWSLRQESTELAKTLAQWMEDSASKRLAIKNQNDETARGGKRKSKITPRAPIKNLAAGIISDYDPLFKRHAQAIGWDWRLLAAQAYQESAFDPKAVSWAGAQGLLQLMPDTAKDLNITHPFNPQDNVKGAVEYLNRIASHFSDISDPEEKIKFMLASYNCGVLHVKDAQALAQKYGKDPHIWTGHVDRYVRSLAEPRYYRDPVVKYGYCRGNEPYNYVIQIFDRFRQYRSRIHG